MTNSLKHPDDEGRSFIETSPYFHRITQRRIPGDSNLLAPVKEEPFQSAGGEKQFISSRKYL
jgi:hypothetical protein